MKITLLENLIARFESSAKREQECVQQIAAFTAREDSVVEKAAGADDAAALAALDDLSGQKSRAHRILEISRREQAGLEISLAHEAGIVKQRVRDELLAQRDKIAARLDAKLADFFSEEQQRAAVVQCFLRGSPNSPQPRLIRAIGKAVARFPDPPAKTPGSVVKWSRGVLNAARLAAEIKE